MQNTEIVKKLEKYIQDIQGQILTSNSILPRAKYPFYCTLKCTSEALTNFKERLALYRQTSSELLQQHALVDLDFLNIQEGMEKTHRVLVISPSGLPGIPPRSSWETFLNALPSDCLIADPFLSTVFSAKNSSPLFQDYIQAYGGQVVVGDAFHLNRWTPRSIKNYLETAVKIKKQMESLPAIEKDFQYSLAHKILTSEPSSLTLCLAQWLGVYAESYQDANTYAVDGLFYCDTVKHQERLQTLSQNLRGHGRWRQCGAQKVYVLEGLNLTETESLLPKYLKDFLPVRSRGTEFFKHKFLEEQKNKAKVVFCIVDLKLTEKNEVKILEFGQGMASRFSGLYGAKKENIEQQLELAVKSAGLPPLYLNTSPADVDVLCYEKKSAKIAPKTL